MEATEILSFYGNFFETELFSINQAFKLTKELLKSYRRWWRVINEMYFLVWPFGDAIHLYRCVREKKFLATWN